jgi:hypothetical protein
MADSAKHVWRKHAYVLIMSTGVQWVQIILSLLFEFVGIPLLRRRLGLDIPPLVGLGILTIFFCLWTVIHLNRGIHSTPPTSNGDSSALARRQALLTKLSTPIKRMIGLSSVVMTFGVIIITILTLATARQWLWAPIIVYYGFLATWLAIEIADWYNDQYILTADRIIDIMRLPVIYEQRTEAPLAMVQNATTYQKGLGAILNFGNVQVETAGQARAILFESVWRPRKIQEEIFQHIDALEQTERARVQTAQHAHTKRWIEAYHTLTSGIHHIRYDETVTPKQAIHIQWRIQGPAGKRYRTWIDWDLVSHADDEEEYALHLRPERKPWYQGGIDIDGIGGGLHHIRGFSAPAGQQALYFRVVVWFEGIAPLFSSPEMTIAIREPSRV